jgi:uncharacterized protein with von Willebrand factor type A (vWA) domain
MDIPKNRYTDDLAQFLGKLRDGGLLVGTSDATDVIALLGALDLTDRAAVRESLKAALAKSKKEQRVFGKCFDAFFVSKAVLAERETIQNIQDAQRRHRIDTARDALPGVGISDELAEAYANAADERKAWLKNMLDYAQDGNRNLPLMKEYLKRVATGWLNAEAGFGLAAADEAEGADADLLHKNLATITEDEVPQALRLIEALVRRINLAAGRKRGRTGRRGMPDLRRTIHESLRTGGIPVKPIYKKRPRASRRMLILCDISESMYLFSEFALRLITALGRESGRTRAFIFSEGAEEIGLEDLSRFEQTVKSSALWRRGTDIGGALAYLAEARPPVLDSSVTLIVLSDAKTIAPPLAEAALETVKNRTRAIIWLNPDRQFSAFAERLAERVVMLRAGTLDELAHACARLN